MKRITLFIALMILVWAGQARAQRMAVSVNKANVRSGPGTNYEILWTVGKYYPLDVLSTSGNWHKVRDFEDDEGWIHGSLLKKIPALAVEATLVNVRKGPGTSHKILFQAEKGVSFKRLAKEGKWFKVQHADGEKGWIHRSLVWGY